MYLQGMGDVYNDDEFIIYDDGGYQTGGGNFPVYSPGPVPSGQPGSGTDWAGLLNTAITTWGTVETQQARNEAAKNMPLRYPYGYPGYPSSSPFPGQPGYPGIRSGTLFGMSPTTLLLLAAAGVAVVMLNDRR